MAINETIASGKYRQCIDEINKIWKRYSLWNKAADTECEDGQTVEEKVGAIKGITTDLNVTDTGYAADVTMLTQLYSEIQDLQNGLSALDTRVTNAITGGDLAAPYTLNFLNTPYTDVGANPYSDPDYKTNFTTSTPTAWAATQPKGSSGYSATVYRNYQTTVKIGKNYKLKYNFSGTYSNAMGEGLSLLLCEGSTVLQKIKANGSGNTHTASGELDLSLYVGKTVNIKFMVVTWTGYGFSAAFNTLSITNK